MTTGHARGPASAARTTLADVKRRQRSTWEAGDFARIAELGTLAAGADLVDRVGVRPGMDVLDVATGTGNAALPAAAAGARVTGLDIAPGLLEKAQERARNRGLDVKWVEGDAENLPFADARFGSVLSTFGIQFAPRHEVAARELVRVCAPGGVIGLANWTPDSPPMRVLALVATYLPPPRLAGPPSSWGSEEHVKRLFAGTGVELQFGRGTVYFEHEGSTDEFVAFYASHFGPLVVARQQLSAGPRWNELQDGLVELWQSARQADDGGRFRAPADYLVVRGRKQDTAPVQ